MIGYSKADTASKGSNMKHYDIAVIGAGSGGLKAALVAQQQGARVVLLEKNKIGGDCTHTGCIPSKTFINAANRFHGMRHAEDLGLPALNPAHALDFAAVMEHVNDVVQDIYLHEWPLQYDSSGVDVIVDSSGAKFLNQHEIQIGDETLRADHSILCTGSSPREANKVGKEELVFLNNENFWDIRELPHSIVFLGGGVISAELGQALTRFGSHVTIIDRNPRILKILDEEVGGKITEIFKREGLHFFTDAEINSCEALADNKTRINLQQADGNKIVTAEAIFVALGRNPNVSGMDLKQAGIEYDAMTGIQTNEFLQTTAENIYACGDVTSKAKFTHVAGYQATVCVKNIIDGNKTNNDLSVLPWVIFTEPEIAHVGLSETKARETLGQVQVVKVDATIDRFITEGQTEGMLKVVLDEQDRVIGADAIGAHAGEWIQLLTMAIKHNLSPQDFSETIVAYPTHSDIVRKAFNRFSKSKTA